MFPIFEQFSLLFCRVRKWVQILSNYRPTNEAKSNTQMRCGSSDVWPELGESVTTKDTDKKNGGGGSGIPRKQSKCCFVEFR